MAVYIVKEGKKLTIITVRPQQEQYFQADYAGKVLVVGDSIQDVLIRFGQLPQLSELNEELNQGKSPSRGGFNDLLPNQQEVVAVNWAYFFYSIEVQLKSSAERKNGLSWRI